MASQLTVMLPLQEVVGKQRRLERESTACAPLQGIRHCYTGPEGESRFCSEMTVWFPVSFLDTKCTARGSQEQEPQFAFPLRHLQPREKGGGRH